MLLSRDTNILDFGYRLVDSGSVLMEIMHPTELLEYEISELKCLMVLLEYYVS